MLLKDKLSHGADSCWRRLIYPFHIPAIFPHPNLPTPEDKPLSDSSFCQPKFLGPLLQRILLQELIFPFSYWTFELLSVLDYQEQCCWEHSCIWYSCHTYASIFAGDHPGIELLGHRIAYVQFYYKMPNEKIIAQIYPFPNSVWQLPLFHILTATWEC